MSHPLAGKHIIVAGAGISGLSFARALDRSWPKDVAKPSITIYERAKETDRGRGYTMSLNTDSGAGGLGALKDLGLLDGVFQDSITYHHRGQLIFRFWDPFWNCLLDLDQNGEPPEGIMVARMRLTRRSLCRHLLEAIPSYVKVQYGTTCTSASQGGDEKVSVALGDGSQAECDLLVVADGANSKIRASLRPLDTLQFAGAVIMSGTARFPNGLPNVTKGLFGMVLGGNGTSLFVSAIDAHSAHWGLSYLSQQLCEPIRGTKAAEQSKELLNEAKSRGLHLGQPFEQLVDATDIETLTIFNAQDKPPVKHGDIAKIPVVYIGDSNHAMSPFSGSGANMALMDAVQLAEELAKSPPVSAAVEAFDRRTIPRSSSAISKSHWFISILHSSGWYFMFWKLLLRALAFFLKK